MFFRNLPFSLTALLLSSAAFAQEQAENSFILPNPPADSLLNGNAKVLGSVSMLGWIFLLGMMIAAFLLVVTGGTSLKDQNYPKAVSCFVGAIIVGITPFLLRSIM